MMPKKSLKGWVTGHLHNGILLDKLLEPCCHYHITSHYHMNLPTNLFVLMRRHACVCMGEHIGADVVMSAKLLWGHGKGTRMGFNETDDLGEKTIYKCLIVLVLMVC